MFDIEFESDSLRFLFAPKLQELAQGLFRDFEVLGLKDHFLLFSSGTTSTLPKGYALSRKALLTNARSVNKHLGLTSQDIWGLSLPWYHVGGLSVLARAHLLQNQVVDLGPWKVDHWYEQLKKKKITITTVVPTQVYDLVKNQFRAPGTLRFLIVGGDFLSDELEKRARALGWPVIRTFGMTEVCSQLATARAPGEPLSILDIHLAKTDEHQRLFIKSESLFTLQFQLKEKLHIQYASELLVDGFYPTQDLVRIEDRLIESLGRLDDQIKIKGKLTSLSSLKNLMETYTLQHGLFGKIELFLVDDERSGKEVILGHLPEVKIGEELLDLFHPLKVKVREIPDFARTDLGKLKKL